MQCQYWILKIFSRVLCLFPYRLILLFGNGIGLLHCFFGHSQRRRAIEQMQERMRLPHENASALVKRMFRQIGCTLLEILYLPALTSKKLSRLVTIENAHYLRSATENGKGAVILTAHFGTWEWMGARLAMEGFPMAGIAKEQPNSGLDRLLNEYRSLAGIEPYIGGNALFAAMKALRRGNVIGFLADQDGKEDGVFVKFFDVFASTPKGPALFAIRAAVPVVPAFIIRHGRGHRILIHPPIYRPEGVDEDQAIVEMTAAMTEIMEKRIRQYPEHWWWFQRRWLTSPKTE